MPSNEKILKKFKPDGFFRYKSIVAVMERARADEAKKIMKRLEESWRIAELEKENKELRRKLELRNKYLTRKGWNDDGKNNVC